MIDYRNMVYAVRRPGSVPSLVQVVDVQRGAGGVVAVLLQPIEGDRRARYRLLFSSFEECAHTVHIPRHGNTVENVPLDSYLLVDRARMEDGHEGIGYYSGNVQRYFDRNRYLLMRMDARFPDTGRMHGEVFLASDHTVGQTVKYRHIAAQPDGVAGPFTDAPAFGPPFQIDFDRPIHAALDDICTHPIPVQLRALKLARDGRHMVELNALSWEPSGRSEVPLDDFLDKEVFPRINIPVVGTEYSVDLGTWWLIDSTRPGAGLFCENIRQALNTGQRFLPVKATSGEDADTESFWGSVHYFNEETGLLRTETQVVPKEALLARREGEPVWHVDELCTADSTDEDELLEIRPDYMHPYMDRTFGIELEGSVHINVDELYHQSDIEEVLEELRADIESSTGRGCVIDSNTSSTHPSHWKITRDGSIKWDNWGALFWDCQHCPGDCSRCPQEAERVGIELVSPILKGRDGLKELKRLFLALEAHGWEGNLSCGTHIHIGMDDVDVPQLVNLVRCMSMFEPLLMLTQASHRRTLHFCKPVRYAFAKEVWKLPPTTVRYMRGHKGVIGRLYYQEQDFHATKYHNERYRGMNLNSLWYRGTVEFRYFNAADTFEQAASYLYFCSAVVWYAGLPLETVVSWQAGLIALTKQTGKPRVERIPTMFDILSIPEHVQEHFQPGDDPGFNGSFKYVYTDACSAYAEQTQ